MRVQIVDPSAFTPPYDHALCAALARSGAQVELVTSRFAYGTTPSADGYAVRELFYRHAQGPAGSRRRAATKMLEHVPDMLAYRRIAAAAEIAHFQWLTIQPLDRHLLPRRPTVLTAHDLLPREPRPLQIHGQRRLYDAVDAIVVHSEHGRAQLVQRLGVEEAKVRVIHHGAFDYLPKMGGGELPPELRGGPRRRAVLFFGLLRPYKGLGVLLEAWRALARSELDADAELWIVGRPRMAIDALITAAPPGVRWVPRFVSDRELTACFEAAELVVLPYLSTDRFDFSGVLATALAFGKPTVLSEVGGFSEVAEAGGARLVPPGDVEGLTDALRILLTDPVARGHLADGARAAAAGPYSWDAAAESTLALYRDLLR